MTSHASLLLLLLGCASGCELIAGYSSGSASDGSADQASDARVGGELPDGTPPPDSPRALEGGRMPDLPAPPDGSTDGSPALSCKSADVNNDSVVDHRDAYQTYKCIGKTTGDVGCSRADVNASGAINAVDVTLVIGAAILCGAPQPCAASALYQLVYHPDMVECFRLLGPTVDQCRAGALCGAGWHLCDTTEFVARGGLTTGSTGADWLAGCVRDVAMQLGRPSAGICTKTCVIAGSGSDIVAQWSCGGAPASSTTDFPLGVVAAPTCARIGVNDSAYAAFWSVKPTTATFTGAVCCR